MAGSEVARTVRVCPAEVYIPEPMSHATRLTLLFALGIEDFWPGSCSHHPMPEINLGISLAKYPCVQGQPSRVGGGT